TVVEKMVKSQAQKKKKNKDIEALINNAVKKQAIRDAKSVFKKTKKNKYKTVTVLKKPIIVWNNQNYTINHESVKMPFVVNGKSQRIEIKANISEYERGLIQTASKLGTLRITRKGRKYVAQIAIERNVKEH